MDIPSLVHDPLLKKLLLSAGLGAIIGLERELAGKDPSLRTFTLISIGSCLFSIISVTGAAASPISDPTRIAAQIIPGIGFLGAGAIFRSSARVSGYTTAALMWVTAAIGMAVGYNQEALAVSSTIISLAVLYLLQIVHRIIHQWRKKRHSAKTTEIAS